MKKPMLSQKSFDQFVIISTIVFTLACIAIGDYTQASTVIIHDSIQAVTAPIIPESLPDPVTCSLSSVDCPEEVVQKAPVAPTKPVAKVVKVKIASVSSNEKPIKVGASRVQQAHIDYAWQISHDRDFIYTLDTENASTWDINMRSYVKGANGYYDRGICQFNKGYHPEIVNNKNFNDAGWQIDQCWKHYKSGTRFYGYDVRWKSIKNFKWE